MALTTTTNFAPAIQATYDNILLSTPTRKYIYSACADRRTMPARGGNIIRFQRINRLAAAKVPLGNTGATPPSTNVTSVYVNAKVDFYGSWIGINEQVVLQNQCPVLTAFAIQLGIQYKQTEDELIRDMLSASAGAINCTAGFNGDVPTEITGSDIFGVTTQLQSEDAIPLSEMREGAMKFGTAPTFDAYFAFCHTDLIGDLHNINGFRNKAEYPNQENVLPAEIGTYGYARFLGSSGGSTTPVGSFNGATVYNVIFSGVEGYGIVDQEGYPPQFIYNSPVYAGGPLRQNSTAAWKAAFTTRILNDAWVVNLRCTRSR
jgi:N4-gp56 family major capsid protein